MRWWDWELAGWLLLAAAALGCSGAAVLLLLLPCCATAMLLLLLLLCCGAAAVLPLQGTPGLIATTKLPQFFALSLFICAAPTNGPASSSTMSAKFDDL